LQKLEDLDLSCTKNLLTLPEGIGNLTSLRTLDLHYSNIRSLPSSIGQLQKLEDLGLSYTKNLLTLPEEIGNLINLKTLRLNKSNIASLPPSIGQLQKLEYLGLACTKNLLTLPEEIGNLSKLEWLHLECSGITSLPDSLQNLRTPLRLHICKSGIPCLKTRGKEAFLVMLAKSIKSLVHLDVGRESPKLSYQLAYNKARYETGFGYSGKKNPVQETPNLWPFVLKSRCFSYTNVTYDEPDAIYCLLSFGRESFVGVVLNCRRQTMNVV
jgi:hypothetical protein